MALRIHMVAPVSAHLIATEGQVVLLTYRFSSNSQKQLFKLQQVAASFISDCK